MSFSIPTNRELAEKVHQLILSDLSVYDSVTDLAHQVGTNPFTLKKVFKQYYHQSVFDFSRSARMDKAKALLLHTNYTLQTIAEMVGYTEGNNFQVAFKSVVGETPGAWRKKFSP